MHGGDEQQDLWWNGRNIDKMIKRDVNNEKMMLEMLGTTTKQWENDEEQQGWLGPKNMLKDV